ncbi:hypothetical protein DSY14_05440 [Nocardiopsis sp. MG754419]|nr:hypothetical protein [Nocardiopsis sp. MG754419]
MAVLGRHRPGDGVLLAAGPLLVASLTGSAVVVAGASAAQRLPAPLFSSGASGAVPDRGGVRRRSDGAGVATPGRRGPGLSPRRSDERTGHAPEAPCARPATPRYY